VEQWVRDELARYNHHASNVREISEPRACGARYDDDLDRIVVELTNGCQFVFPPALVQGLAGALPEALAKVEITPAGGGLHWEQLDVDLSVPNLALGVFGTRAWMRALASRGGSSRSPAKARASRANGRKGGRPRNNRG
jgi:hypothetical protein